MNIVMALFSGLITVIITYVLGLVAGEPDPSRWDIVEVTYLGVVFGFLLQREIEK